MNRIHRYLASVTPDTHFEWFGCAACKAPMTFPNYCVTCSVLFSDGHWPGCPNAIHQAEGHHATISDGTCNPGVQSSAPWFRTR
jgi:hypothetical protein